MLLNSINNLNFGLRFTNDMITILKKSKKEIAKNGKKESDDFDSLVTVMKNSLPDSFILGTKPNFWSIDKDIFISSINGYSEDLFRLRENQLLTKENMNEIISKLKIK